MPLYEYQCDACGHRVELIQKFSDPAPAACTACTKGPMRRMQSSPAIQFKGSGFYITDYARKGSGEPATASKNSEGDSKTSGGKTPDAGAKTDSGSKAEPAAPSATPATETKT